MEAAYLKGVYMTVGTTTAVENQELTEFIFEYLKGHGFCTLGNLLRLVHQDQRFRELEQPTIIKSFFVLANERQVIRVEPISVSSDDPERYGTLLVYKNDISTQPE
jgi:hypothetical protein